MSHNSFKNKVTDKLIAYKSYIYIYIYIYMCVCVCVCVCVYCGTDKCVEPVNFCVYEGMIDKGLNKWQKQVNKIKNRVFIERIVYEKCSWV